MVRGMNKKKSKTAVEDTTRGDNELATLKKAASPMAPRARDVTDEMLDERARRAKAWARYSIRCEHEVTRDLCRATARRDAALDALRQMVNKLI